MTTELEMRFSSTNTIIEILIVDDDATNRELAVRQLNRLGYKTAVARNGWEAVEAVQHKTYHLILMDYQMPELDGCEATRYIRAFEAQNKRQPVPIIAFTANTALDSQVCLQAGMNDYINKPAGREALQQLLTRWLVPTSAMEALPVVIQADSKNQVEYLQELLDENALGADILAHIIEIYLQDSPTQVEALRPALAGQNLSSLRRIAHTLKSASYSLNAKQLGKICAELEKHEGCESEKIRLISEIETSHQLFIETLQLFSQQYLTVTA